MKSFLSKFQTMNFDQLIAVNGGYGGGSGGSGSSSCSGGGYSSSSGLTAARYVNARNRAKELAAKAAAKNGGSSYSLPSSGYDALTNGLNSEQYTQARDNAEKKKKEEEAATAKKQAELEAQKKAEYEAFNAYIEDQKTKKGEYDLGTFDCDIWVQETLKNLGKDITEQWNDAKTTNVAGHEQALEGQTTNTPDNGWSVVLMTDSDKYSINHTGLIRVNDDGSCDLYQNSKYNPYEEHYSSVKEFENAYAYNDFDYLHVLGKK